MSVVNPTKGVIGYLERNAARMTALYVGRLRLVSSILYISCLFQVVWWNQYGTIRNIQRALAGEGRLKHYPVQNNSYVQNTLVLQSSQKDTNLNQRFTQNYINLLSLKLSRDDYLKKIDLLFELKCLDFKYNVACKCTVIET